MHKVNPCYAGNLQDKSLRRSIGKEAENLAVDFLKRRGYKILERNYNTKVGELDIIAKENSTICFVEVKSRSSLKYGSPLDAITKDKRYKMYKTAMVYLKRNSKLFDYKCRFDVVSVLKDKKSSFKIELIENAF